MGVQITIDVVKAEERIGGMLEKLAVLPVAAELTAWQREDMNRRYPNTEEINQTTALTLIWPRSRRQVARQNRAPRRKPLLRGRATRIAKPAGDRPILRPELFDRLCERMSAMMARELQW